MVKRVSLKEYKRVISCVELDEEAKQRIIRNCARRSTLEKIKKGKSKLISVKKDKVQNY